MWWAKYGRVSMAGDISDPKGGAQRSALAAELSLAEIGFLGHLALGGFLGQSKLAQARHLLGLRLALPVLFLERFLVALFVLVPQRLRPTSGFEVSLGISHRGSPAGVPALRGPAAQAIRLVAFALEALAHGLPISANGFALLARPALRGLLVGAPALHLAKGAFALHLLLEDA